MYVHVRVSGGARTTARDERRAAARQLAARVSGAAVRAGCAIRARALARPASREPRRRRQPPTTRRATSAGRRPARSACGALRARRRVVYVHVPRVSGGARTTAPTSRSAAARGSRADVADTRRRSAGSSQTTRARPTHEDVAPTGARGARSGARGRRAAWRTRSWAAGYPRAGSAELVVEAQPRREHRALDARELLRRAALLRQQPHEARRRAGRSASPSRPTPPRAARGRRGGGAGGRSATPRRPPRTRASIRRQNSPYSTDTSTSPQKRRIVSTATSPARRGRVEHERERLLDHARGDGASAARRGSARASRRARAGRRRGPRGATASRPTGPDTPRAGSRARASIAAASAEPVDADVVDDGEQQRQEAALQQDLEERGAVELARSRRTARCAVNRASSSASAASALRTRCRTSVPCSPAPSPIAPCPRTPARSPRASPARGRRAGPSATPVPGPRSAAT